MHAVVNVFGTAVAVGDEEFCRAWASYEDAENFSVVPTHEEVAIGGKVL